MHAAARKKWGEIMILERFKLTGKVAIVTGCSTGLGQGMSLGLARGRRGYRRRRLCGSPRDQTADRELWAADSWASRPILPARSRSPALSRRPWTYSASIDILVNNAGIIRRADALEFTEKDWDDVLNINLKTVFFFSQAAAKEFVKQGTGGKIVNVASMLSFQGGIRVPSYTASKSGVVGHHPGLGQ